MTKSSTNLRICLFFIFLLGYKSILFKLKANTISSLYFLSEINFVKQHQK
ncbi:hypothetical protein J500_0872 [Acinetobacter sp. 479375]|nr:hypothetical protein J500_0872 [Acinetobacter sp. 479375]